MTPDRLGATPLPGGECRFLVWAPQARRVEVHIVAPVERRCALEPGEQGYHAARVPDVGPGARYFYVLDSEVERPDPASRLQPQGVHGPSEVVDPAFPWTDDAWEGMLLSAHILYELHVGAFTPEGTFDAAIGRLASLAELGVNAIELMPVAQFPGTRNWGYDGVYPYAVQNSYGGPHGLKRLVDAAHRAGLAVLLDVVYNHLGPEGNYLSDFGPYFTDRYRTPWGKALNFDGADSDEVRRFFVENAVEWVENFHLDGLRIDAVHAIHDASATPFLRELCGRARGCGRRAHLIAESDLNDARVVSAEGLGFDATWSDDLHHALHALLTGEREGYYADFGRVDHVARAITHGWTYSGQYSTYRRRRHGNSARGLGGDRFVVCSQNHDQVGNRMMGERLGTLVPFEAAKLAAGVVILSPFVPLLFMGEEYGENAPFQYFVSHGDADLVRAVREGRRREFKRFAWKGTPPDPQDEATFRRCVLDPARGDSERGRATQAWYRELLRLRGRILSLACGDRGHGEAGGGESPPFLWIHRRMVSEETFAVFHFSDKAASVELPLPRGRWTRVLDSANAAFGGPGVVCPWTVDSEGTASCPLAPWNAVLFRRNGETV